MGATTTDRLRERKFVAAADKNFHFSMGQSGSASAKSDFVKLPLLGNGTYGEVGCADIMISPENTEDTGIFARVFYPASSARDLNSEPIDYPLWRPRNEYVEGLANYRNMGATKMHFFYDWIVGERRVAAGWHEPLYSLRSDRQKNWHSTTDLRNYSPEIHISRSENFLGEKVEEPRFPVIVFSHGISGNRLCYSTVCASLASYGFVVVAVEHRDRSSSWTYFLETDPLSGTFVEKPVTIIDYPDGEGDFGRCNRQLQHRVTECIRALEIMKQLNLGTCGPMDSNPRGGRIVHGLDFDWQQFKGRLKVEESAIVGHSMGAATALATASVCSDFRTAVSLDGWLFPIDEETYSNITQPILLLNASKWQWKENVQRMMKLQNAAELNIFTLSDIVHQSFSDFAFLMPGYMGRKFALQGDLDPTQTGAAILELTVSHLWNCFESGSSNQKLKKVAERYSNFVSVGTDLANPPRISE